jgi:hypothetical protein
MAYPPLRLSDEAKDYISRRSEQMEQKPLLKLFESAHKFGFEVAYFNISISNSTIALKLDLPKLDIDHETGERFFRDKSGNQMNARLLPMLLAELRSVGFETTCLNFSSEKRTLTLDLLFQENYNLLEDLYSPATKGSTAHEIALSLKEEIEGTFPD